MSPNCILRMSETRFICARKSRHIDHRGDIRGAENGTPMLEGARVSASQAILDRGYGRPATFSTTDTTQFKRAIDMTDDELAAIIATPGGRSAAA
jgi:hypothetical protein